MTNHEIIRYVIDQSLFSADLAQYKAIEGVVEHGLYLSSFQRTGDALFLVSRDDESRSKMVVMISKTAEAFPHFPGQREQIGEYGIARSALTHTLAQFLRQTFPFTAPQSLQGRHATIGTGDRLGLANPAHIRAIKDYEIFPVLAQQSMRELNLTKRTYHDVLDAATFAVFQEGYEEGFGFDGDHLKTIEDITMAIECGATMITLDLSDVMNAAAATWSEAHLLEKYQELPEYERRRLETIYLAQPFTLDEGTTIIFDETEFHRSCVMYLKALHFAKEVYDFLVSKRGKGNFDFELSIDETTAPTLPQHHIFIIRELINDGVAIASLAPRFIGEFQKAIDYIGDVDAFEEQFQVHCQIARKYGNYKISIHSGSDKFSVYPIIGKWTAGRVHIKTAGTSWLEAVRAIAMREPALYRDIHQVALHSYHEALKFYHVTADFNKIKSLDSLSDEELPDYLDLPESRQVLHIIYGFVLQNESLRERLYAALDRHEALHYKLVRDHLKKHITLLGRPKTH